MRGIGGASRGDAGLAENLLDSLATMVTELGALLRAAGLQRCALHATNCNFCSPILRAERGDLRSVRGTELSLVLGGRSRVRRQDTGCELLNRTPRVICLHDVSPPSDAESFSIFKASCALHSLPANALNVQ
jgi:hypothetical protein